MTIFPSLAPIGGNFAATSRVRSPIRLPGGEGLSFSSVCSAGKGLACFRACGESATSQTAAAIQRIKKEGLANLLSLMAPPFIFHNFPGPTDFAAQSRSSKIFPATNEHEYFFRYRKPVGRHFLAHICVHSRSFAAEILLLESV